MVNVKELNQEIKHCLVTLVKHKQYLYKDMIRVDKYIELTHKVAAGEATTGEELQQAMHQLTLLNIATDKGLQAASNQLDKIMELKWKLKEERDTGSLSEDQKRKEEEWKGLKRALDVWREIVEQEAWEVGEDDDEEEDWDH